jgi:hypothetical protein
VDSELRVEKTESRFSDWLGSETVQLKTPILQAQTSTLSGSHRHETNDRRDEDHADQEQNQGRRPLAFRDFAMIAGPEIFAIDVNRLAILDFVRGLHGTHAVSHGSRGG